MSNKLYLLSFILIFTWSCKKNSDKHVSSEENHLQQKIFNVVDSMSLSFPKEYPVNLYTVSYQKKLGKDYIKISTSEFFNKDSISTIELNNKKIIVYYSNNFFKQKKTSMDSYKEFEYTDKTVSLYHPRYTIFEILKNNTYKNISMEDGIKMELFNYSDRYIPEPTPIEK